jgi:hypothetical protein
MSSQDVQLIDGTAKTIQQPFTGRTYSIFPTGVFMGQFIFGVWQEIKMTAEYENWLAAAVDPIVFTALFRDASPGLIAQFRIGRKMLNEEGFIDANFEEISKPPKFDFNQVMRRMEQ